jgi:YARHG domain
MRIGYSASRQHDYQTALINFRRALDERPGDRYASEAANNMENIIGNQNPGSQTSSSNNFAWLSQRRVTNEDLQGKSQFELDVLRNAIYAVHGRQFNRSDLQSYFNQLPWYTPRYSPTEFPNNLLTTLEQANIQFILNYQRNR